MEYTPSASPHAARGSVNSISGLVSSISQGTVPTGLLFLRPSQSASHVPLAHRVTRQQPQISSARVFPPHCQVPVSLFNAVWSHSVAVPYFRTASACPHGSGLVLNGENTAIDIICLTSSFVPNGNHKDSTKKSRDMWSVILFDKPRTGVLISTVFCIKAVNRRLIPGSGCWLINRPV
jgi:hypothetical protein